MNEKTDKTNGFVVIGLILIVISVAAFFWGANYTNNLQNLASAGFSSLMGQIDPTFAAAKVAVNLSPVVFIAGLVIGIYGFFKR